MALVDGYPDAPAEVRAALAAAEAELATFAIPPAALGSIAAIRASMTARQNWRAANPEQATRYDALLQRIERLELQAQAPRPEIVDRELVRCRVPEPVLAAARRADLTKTAIVGAREWVTTPRAERKVAVLLTGPTGTGKSVAAAWVCQRFALFRRWWQGQPSGSVPHVALAWLHGPSVTKEAIVPDDVEAQIEAAVGAELLVVDELEVVGAKAGLLAMASLLTRRYDAGRFTVITTNAGREQIAEGLGSHVADRLGSSHLVATKGPSLRRK